VCLANNQSTKIADIAARKISSKSDYWNKTQWLIAMKHVPQKFITKNVFSLELMEQLLPNLDRSLFRTIEFNTEIKLKFKGHKGQKGHDFGPHSLANKFYFLL